MNSFEGGCHCGTVRFKINVEMDHLIDCNCSVCVKKGIIHIPVQDSQFELLSGEEELSLYQYRSNTAKHWFCRYCGIHAFGRPRSDPSRYTVNARCLDDYDQIATSIPVKHFDGRHHPKDQT